MTHIRTRRISHGPSSALERPKRSRESLFDRFFFRSDHYPYIQYGIPAVWFFCGTTEDYHQESDTIDRVDFQKMEKVARLVYLIGFEIGNMPEILKLDANPQITSRGAHNLQVRWRQ